jgi:U3 small nucleolar RNA-associated protein 10
MWKESLTILRILKNSIDKASRNDIGPLAGKIITALTYTYSFDCDIATRCELVDAGNDTLLAMVMKLSEAQLRPLYGKLREWRGAINEESSNSPLHLRKRKAFGNLSTALVKALRSSVLPCMSTVVGDIAKELEDAVSILCTVSKSSKGSKRVKIDNVASIDPKSLSPLQPLLHCLESALTADAHDGGNWIRGDDGERYTQILRPLMKLLTAQVPDGCDILPVLQEGKIQYTPYQRLVQGETTEDYGNVVNCITSLAAAAGNEQLWKPLNHSLLEACGNEKRSEVRKSGVKSLLSIIHTLGEEYMVLLPECLPVLSELLEDEDEDIVALAKECVQQGEELLGESLEDSLR